MTAILKLSDLAKAGACENQRRLFDEMFGKEVEITVALCVENADKFDWRWAAVNILDAHHRAAFDVAVAPHRAAFDPTLPYRAAFDAAVSTHRAAFDVAMATQWAEQFIAQQDAAK